MLFSRTTCSSLAVASAVLLAPAAHAEWSPDWISTVPVGSALTAGLQGMDTDAAGVTYITGIGGSSSNTDIYTAAFAPDGTELWQQVFNGPGDWHDQARGLCVGSNGNVFVCGNTPGTGNYANVLVLEYEAATGALVNTVQYSSDLFTSEHGASVATDAAGNIYVGGGTTGDGADGLMLSFDANGQFRWSTTYDGAAWGPYSQDHVRQVQVDGNGDVIAMIHGVMSSLHPDFVVIKYRPTDGAILWQANWGVSGGDFAEDMVIDANNDIYVTGVGINFTDQISTIKLRGTDGQLLWQAYDAHGFRDYANAVALDGQGGVYITGATDPDGDQSNHNNDFFTIKRDAETGAQIWTHVYGAGCVGCLDVARDVLVDSAGHALVVGSTSSPPYNGDLILFSLDSTTGVEQDRSVVGGGPSEFAAGSMMRLDDDENIYVGGGYANVNTGAEGMAVFGYASLVAAPPAPGDANGDGIVNFGDVLHVIGAWGVCPPVPDACGADLDGDRVVGFSDVLMVIANWSP
ncbi:MAG: outer membrane protein assembly factor BamB family protein [Planctomycetota bacterium]|jgi:hypothetical protein